MIHYNKTKQNHTKQIMENNTVQKGTMNSIKNIDKDKKTNMKESIKNSIEVITPTKPKNKNNYNEIIWLTGC